MRDALGLETVTFGYGGLPVFRRLDLQVAEGEMVGVLGPNGAGKTTLVRLASGTLRPGAGRVRLFGRGLEELSAREVARRVAVVPQEAQVAFDFTVEEVVLMGRAPHQGLLGIPSARDFRCVRAATERADIASLGSRMFRALSGGEKQRVALARALAQEPRLLLLDEPTAHLDLRHRLSLYRILAELNREGGTTVLVVTHEINLAARHCRRLVLLCAGEVAADGSPEEVLRPEILRRVFEVEADIGRDPASGRPLVVPLLPALDGPGPR